MIEHYLVSSMESSSNPPGGLVACPIYPPIAGHTLYSEEVRQLALGLRICHNVLLSQRPCSRLPLDHLLHLAGITQRCSRRIGGGPTTAGKCERKSGEKRSGILLCVILVCDLISQGYLSESFDGIRSPIPCERLDLSCSVQGGQDLSGPWGRPERSQLNDS